jgi:ferredoxin
LLNRVRTRTTLTVKLIKLLGRIMMKIVVDLNRCQCYAQCAFLAPSVFEIHGEEALMFAPLVPKQEHERVRRAAVACPVQAIVLEDEEEAGSYVL